MEIVQYRTNGNRTEQMEIEPNKWKSIRTNGNRTEQMEIEPNKWKSIRTNGNRTEFTTPMVPLVATATATYRNLRNHGGQ